jgi:hypothetical protein
MVLMQHFPTSIQARTRMVRYSMVAMALLPGKIVKIGRLIMCAGRGVMGSNLSREYAHLDVGADADADKSNRTTKIMHDSTTDAAELIAERLAACVSGTSHRVRATSLNRQPTRRPAAFCIVGPCE